MKYLVSTVLVAICLLGGAQAFADTNILVNPGFESGVLTPWFNDRNFCPANCQLWAIDSTMPHSGQFDAMDVGNIELRQNFTPTAVSSITQVSFWVKHPDGAGTPMAIDLFYTDNSDHEFVVFSTDANYDFFDITADLTPGLTLEGISFFGVTDAGSEISFLDDVTVATSAAVPEPRSLILMGSGLLGIAATVRRRFLN